LRHVNLGHNQIKGHIPSAFFSELSRVEILDLRNNTLTGTVPSTIADMELLEELYLNDNADLKGNLPDAISSMPKLESLDISATQISGDLEAALCNNAKTWESLRADCLDDGTAASCATECCHQDGYCCDMTGQTACEVPPAP
jgi:Ran GTPase-activating protein (RanGAP) involved in mRNA processing and transport